MSITVVCYILAFLCFALGTPTNPGVLPRVNWQNAGFAFLTLSLFVK